MFSSSPSFACDGCDTAAERMGAGAAVKRPSPQTCGFAANVSGAPPKRELCRASLIELLQKTQIVFKKEPQVGDSVAQHGEPFDSEAEREAQILFGVDGDVSQDIRVDDAAAQDFEPAGAAAYAAAGAAAIDAADVHFGRRLGEGKKRCAEAYGQVAPFEETLNEIRQYS